MRKIMTWIALIDGVHTKLLRHEGVGKGLQLIETYSHENIPTRELGTDKQGRSFETVGAMRHSMENTDWHRFEEDHFIISIADLLNRRAEEKSYDRLIIIAPPQTLGVVRQALNHHAKAKMHATIDKDLIHADMASLEKHLGKVMAV